ncbi:MAG: sigma-70 family RNA polymerase sigma factor [Aureliella sp.]
MELAETLRNAKAGDEQSLGELLSSYERYLKLLADVQLGQQLRRKLDASDIVQETFLDAHKAIGRFEGESNEQFVAWLKSILAKRLANTMRHYLGTQARDVRLEARIGQSLDQSALSLGTMLASPEITPSQNIANQEQSQLVAGALSRLPEDYREVIVMRHLEGMTFPEISSAMQRTVNSVEKLWLRGMAKLKREFRNGDHRHGESHAD